MKRIALLRGINVGGKRKILLNDLKQLMETLGLINVVSYIQSGNLIFDYPEPANNVVLAELIQSCIQQKYGFDVPVVVMRKEDLTHAVENNPFYNNATPIENLHCIFLKEKPSKENYVNTLTFDFTPDKFHVADNVVFIFCSGKYHESKLSNNFFEKKLKVNATTRSWKTVLKLMALCN